MCLCGCICLKQLDCFLCEVTFVPEDVNVCIYTCFLLLTVNLFSLRSCIVCVGSC